MHRAHLRRPERDAPQLQRSHQLLLNAPIDGAGSALRQALPQLGRSQGRVLRRQLRRGGLRGPGVREVWALRVELRAGRAEQVGAAGGQEGCGSQPAGGG
jgi:hypothetical protein